MDHRLSRFRSWHWREICSIAIYISTCTRTPCPWTRSTVRLSTGENLNVFVRGDPIQTFFGLTFDQPVTSVLFVDNGNQMFDNVRFEAAPAVPEPSSVLLACAGALLFCAKRGRRP